MVSVSTCDRHRPCYHVLKGVQDSVVVTHHSSSLCHVYHFFHIDCLLFWYERITTTTNTATIGFIWGANKTIHSYFWSHPIQCTNDLENDNVEKTKILKFYQLVFIVARLRFYHKFLPLYTNDHQQNYICLCTLCGWNIWKIRKCCMYTQWENDDR